MMVAIKKIFTVLSVSFLIFFTFNLVKIYNYANKYSEIKSDVAIVLGAGTNDGLLSPIFRERINHSMYLYKEGIVDKIIFTGGIGSDQVISDSEIARKYAVESGIPSKDILMENESRYTYENLIESKRKMDSRGFTTALIVSDPLHMKRSIELAKSIGIQCNSSPTPTSMYRTNIPKLKSLFYEGFFFTLGKITFKH